MNKPQSEAQAYQMLRRELKREIRKCQCNIDFLRRIRSSVISPEVKEALISNTGYRISAIYWILENTKYTTNKDKHS